MQKGGEIGDNVFESSKEFGGLRDFGAFGFRRSMMPSLFGGRDPFDDPFFTDPFHSFLGPSSTSRTMQKPSRDKGIVIEELNSDDEGGNSFPETGDQEGFRQKKYSRSTMEPSVEHPDDDVDENKKNSDATYKNDDYKVEPPKARNVSFQTSRVTYGGVDGAYYSSTRTRRVGADGAVMEESKEADSTTGQATHRITRGIHDKGHSVFRKLESDGKVGTMQTLHNLNEDDLADFEEAWKGNNAGQGPSWKGGYDVQTNQGELPQKFHILKMGGEILSGLCKTVIRLLVSWYDILASKLCHGSVRGEQDRNQLWAFPTWEQHRRTGGFASNYETGTNSSGRTKKVVRINIE